jgi:hypothetical protein
MPNILLTSIYFDHICRYMYTCIYTYLYICIFVIYIYIYAYTYIYMIYDMDKI